MTEVRRTRRVLQVGLIAYTVVIGLATLTPAHISNNHDGPIGAMLALFAAHGPTRWLTFGTVEKLANVAMFVPFGFLLAMVSGRRRWWLGWLFGAAFSCLIEGIQGTLLSATRVADVSDLITNTLGAGIGAVVAWIVGRRSVRRPREQPTEQTSDLLQP